MHPDLLLMAARHKDDDMLREAEHDRLVRVGRATVTAYRNRRASLRLRERGATLTGRVSGRATPRSLVREPAV